MGAPFVVIKTIGKEPTDQSLHEAAAFAAAFSRAWREGFASVDVYWVKPEQLSKASPSGEFVGHGAFVVRGERHWFRGTPLVQSVGVIIDEGGEISFVGGPVEAVKAKTKVSVTIKPGDLAGKNLFRHILSLLAAKMSKDLREKVLRTSIEQIREYIPYGKGRILEA
jgi:hypothetical protein